ncbi:DUF6318 family protein [Psychromicrobium sp. YIM B11713]|uniref:DUF6318 family protein n=1 Tax=Psychromicrobium sp. YIM B11713 TaxID=3145233 RepID=UPI00374ED2A5
MARWSFKSTCICLLLILALGTGLTACSDGGKAAPSSSASLQTASQDKTTPATLPSPSPTQPYQPATVKGPAKNVPVPVKPPEADEFSERGLKAFAAYWFNVFNYAAETGDTESYEKITQSTCTYCYKIIGNIKALYKSKGWNVGGKVIVTRTQLTKAGFKTTPDNSYQVIIQSNQTAGQTLNSDGSVNDTQNSSVANGEVLDAVYLAGRWKASNIGKIS